MLKAIQQWKHKREIKKICKANNYNCSECIYHDFIFEGVIFRGVKCRLESHENERKK